MGGKRQLDADANLSTVLVANSSTRSLQFCQILEELLKETVESDTSKIKGQVKICYDDSLKIYDGCPTTVPTIQWITKNKSDGRADTWETEPFFLTLIGSNAFEDLSRNCRRPEDLIKGVFQLPSTSPDHLRFLHHRQARVLVYDERKRPNSKHSNPEVKRLEDKNMFKRITECEVMANISFCQGLKVADAAMVAVRATKSVLDAVTKDDFTYVVTDGATGEERINWYPKKAGPPAQVTKNDSHTGLHLLWQKHLQQISKRVGIEQAKVIASDPDFQSPKNLFETYRRCASRGGEGETLLQHKQTRPSGSSRDVASLGSGQSLGPDISKKVHTMFTVKGDGLTYLQEK